jgi:RND family efflux transporter MFP subunit
MPPTAVVLQRAASSPIQDTSEYVATLKSMQSTTVQPQIDGQITQIFVRSGERVRQGAQLFQIDPRRQQAAVESQQAERAARQADVEFARQQEVRAQNLFDAGAISRQELEQAQTARLTAEAALQALDAQLQQQQVQLRYFTVTAPTAGIVGDVPVRVGSQVGTQTTLTTIDQNDTLEVYTSVPLERASDLKTGLPLQVLSGDGSQALATTTVNFISPHVDPETQTVLVKGSVRNLEGALRTSQFVRARIVWKTTEGLTIPVTAVVRINGQFFGFVAERSDQGLVARQRLITVGPIVDDSYVLLSGISEGEQMVVSGAQKLQEGMPIAEGQAGGPGGAGRAGQAGGASQAGGAGQRSETAGQRSETAGQRGSTNP